LIARGFQEDTTNLEVYSPVANAETVKTVIGLAAVHDYPVVDQIDFSTAFLQAQMKREVLVRLPPGTMGGTKKEPTIARLRRPLYGLADSPARWNDKLHDALTRVGMTRSLFDSCLYTLKGEEGQLVLAVCVWIDDLLVVGQQAPYKMLKKFLESSFKVKFLGPASVFLGIEIRRDQPKGLIVLTQKKFVTDILEEFGMSDCNPKDVPLSPGTILSKNQSPKTDEEKNEMKQVPYQTLVGKLLYLARWTRGDIAAVVSKLARYNSNPGPAHWKAAKGVLRYLAGTRDMSLIYGTDKQLEGYSDADMGGDLDTRKSTSGSAVIYAGAAVAWKSRLQTLTSLSTQQAEFVGLCNTVKLVLSLRALLMDLGEVQLGPTPIHVDNQGVIKVGCNPTENHGGSKYYLTKKYFVRDHVQTRAVELLYVPTKDNTADILTKPLPKAALMKLRSQLLGH